MLFSVLHPRLCPLTSEIRWLWATHRRGLFTGASFMQNDHVHIKRVRLAHLKGLNLNDLLGEMARTVFVYVSHHDSPGYATTVQRVQTKQSMYPWAEEPDHIQLWQEHSPFERQFLCHCSLPAPPSSQEKTYQCNGTDRSSGLPCLVRFHEACISNDDAVDNTDVRCGRCQDGSDRTLSAFETGIIDRPYKCPHCPFRYGVNDGTTFRYDVCTRHCRKHHAEGEKKAKEG